MFLLEEGKNFLLILLIVSWLYDYFLGNIRVLFESGVRRFREIFFLEVEIVCNKFYLIFLIFSI